MSFKEIKGHDQAIYALKQDLEQGRLAASYLFLGPEGVGKRKTAVTLAKALNCQKEELDTSTAHPQTPLSINPEHYQDNTGEISVFSSESRGIDSCDSCPSCLKIDAQNHPDVHWITGVTGDYIKIEDIRQLKKEIGLRPYEGKRKVFIIDNAHLFTAEASNALLKILEEPPGQASIILVSSKFALLFKTIVSRCRIIRFYPLARSGLAEILKEDYRLDALTAHFLAYFCEGRLGRGVELKDTDILKEKNKVIDEFALFSRPNEARAVIEHKETFRNYLNILSTWFRDIYMAKIGLPQTELIHLDRKADLLKVAERYNFSDLEVIMNFISDSLRYLEENINPKLLLSNLRMELSKT
jgi:DNA polymerase-3 subunit delta'